MIYTVLDTETNGFKGSSVLEFYAVSFELDHDLDPINMHDIHRFYYPLERFNPGAIRVHGLTGEYIRILRGSSKYAEHFLHDPDIGDFLCKSDCVIGHNISFDLGFIDPSCFKDGVKTFCTMRNNNRIIRGRRGYKQPKLVELAEYYNIYHSDEEFHGAKYDTHITLQVFISMIKKDASFTADNI
ncbi:MAG: exonuclease domain-containing protein [Candidatus Muiribacteriaceae bacterium]